MSTTTSDRLHVNRRRFLGAAGGAALLGTVPVRPATAAGDPFDGWFDAVPNYDGVTDHRGAESVRVLVGPDGDLVFDPPAIRSSPDASSLPEAVSSRARRSSILPASPT